MVSVGVQCSEKAFLHVLTLCWNGICFVESFVCSQLRLEHTVTGFIIRFHKYRSDTKFWGAAATIFTDTVCYRCWFLQTPFIYRYALILQCLQVMLLWLGCPCTFPYKQKFSKTWSGPDDKGNISFNRMSVMEIIAQLMGVSAKPNINTRIFLTLGQWQLTWKWCR